jgi:hypothetical protein
MQIDGVNFQGPGVHPLGKAHPKDQKAEEAPDQPVTEQESTVQQTTESSDSDGVLRLLQEGHFNGVSDIRLRINFYDELAAIEAEQLQAVADEQIDGILQSVGTIVGTLVEDSVPAPQSTPVLPPSPPPPNTSLIQQAPSPVPNLAPPPPVDANGDGVIDSLQAITVNILTATIEPPPPPPAEPDVDQLNEEFTETVNQLKEDFLAAEAPSTDTLLEGIQSAFDQLVESLESALEQPNGVNEPPTNIEMANVLGGVIEPPDESAPQTEPVIEDLTAAFNTAMDQLIDAFGEVTVLTPTSEPNGNGGAYNKFLNIYNEMREST